MTWNEKFNTWNPVFNIVMKIKQRYLEVFGFGDLDDSYKRNRKEDMDLTCLEYWIKQLDIPEYTDFISCLQVNQIKDFILIRYGLAEMQAGMWSDPNSIYRECRSIVIDIDRDEMVLVPFRKFFNMNEVAENTEEILREEIKNAKNVEFSNKLDGSMQNARWYNGNIFLSGSQAIDASVSWRLEDGYAKLTEGHKAMIKENPIYTFSFEYISKKDMHVVEYSAKDEGMYLIGMRSILDGRQLAYYELKGFATRYNVPMTEIENKTLDEILTESKYLPSNEREGWVINIDGHLVKLKCEDYVCLHKTINKIASINVVIQQVADDTFDDFISKVPEAYRGRILEAHDKIVKYVQATEAAISKAYQAAPKEDRKEFMLWVDANVDKTIKGYVRQKYLKQPYHLIAKGSGKQKGYKSAREMGFYDEADE